MKNVVGTYNRTPFWKLRDRCHDHGLYDVQAAQAIGISQATFSRRMRGILPWKTHEIATLCSLLDIPPDKIGTYFFPESTKEKIS